MVTRTIIRINSSEAEQWTATAPTNTIDNIPTAIKEKSCKASDVKMAAADALHNKQQKTSNNKRKRQQNPNLIDLIDVPPQPPIPKSETKSNKKGASKYVGVNFNKQKNKWHAQITIEGKQRHIGYYNDEKDAAVDYARALFKYKGEKKRHKSCGIDLNNVPPLPSTIPKSCGHVNEGASIYPGVYFDKQINKWAAYISICGKQQLIGHYDDEKKAAVDYTSAIFKSRERVKRKSAFIDLSDVPPQPPIPKYTGHVKEGASEYTGVSFKRPANKWVAIIAIEGKQRVIGYYDDEEKAAVDYARAVLRFKEGVKDRGQRGSFVIDLSDVPPQPPIPKSSGRAKEGASKYTGVHFHKQSNRWNAQIVLDGNLRHIGCYDDEEKAAVDYARAVFKYREGARHQNHRKLFAIDLSDVPPQPPIPKSSGRVKEGASKYTGVYFNKHANKWHAVIAIEGKQRLIGCYNDEEDAAVDYARALFKYRGGG